MNDHFVPEGIHWWGSFWLTLTSDPFLIHFLHRWWAWGAAIALFILASRLTRVGGTQLAFTLSAMVLFQIMLGIATVLTGVSLPIAVLHQGTGALLLCAAVMSAHRIGRSIDAR
jgi:cytochrome c oxidase assembly protein subunit 15